jgi:hypothetical protein
VWKRLSDTNTLSLIGVYMHGPELVMVTRRMDNGNIKQCLQRNTCANKPALVNPPPHFLIGYCCPSTSTADVARGVVYLQCEYHPRASEKGNVNNHSI